MAISFVFLALVTSPFKTLVIPTIEIAHDIILQFKSTVCKKAMSNSPGLVDFGIRLVNSFFNLPDRQVMFFEQSE